MSEFGFIGAAYRTRSSYSGVEECINLFVERGSGGMKGEAAGNVAQVLYGTPGLSLFCTLPDGPLRCLYSPDSGDSCFAVAGATAFQLFRDGTYLALGQVGLAGTKCWMLANGSQLLVVSGDELYLYTGLAMSQVAAGFQIAYIDGYYIAAQQYSDQFNISALNNGLSWDALDFAILGGAPDHIVSMLANDRELWFLCQQHTEVWDDSGNPDFPFSRNQSGFIEEGCRAFQSAVNIKGSIYCLGSNRETSTYAWRSVGYQAQRFSNPAVEWAWSQYAYVADAVGWTYDSEGHTFYCLWFPSADVTWVYDLTTDEWHQRTWLDPVAGVTHAHLACCHAYAFANQHLVGDRQSGNVYVLASTNYSDNGNPIRRVRTAPHISKELHRTFYQQFQLDAQVGVGPSIPLLDGSGNPRDPQAMLQWSDDGGNTWTDERYVSLGQIGKYRTRAIWRRLGWSYERAYRVVISDPVPVALIGAYLEYTQGVS